MRQRLDTKAENGSPLSESSSVTTTADTKGGTSSPTMEAKLDSLNQRVQSLNQRIQALLARQHESEK
jgi:hypothetical protein